MDAILQPRRSRVRRQSRGRRLCLSSRDIEIFRLLERYRYLRSSFVCAFFPDADRTGLIKRLGDLFHEGYLDRPVQQYQYANALYLPAVYELNERSIAALRDYGHVVHSRPIVPRQFSHQLMIADAVASIELGTRERPLRFITACEIMAKAPRGASERGVSLRASVLKPGVAPAEVYVVPDALFGLEYQNKEGSAYRFFALEADRNTMPVSRARLEQSSYMRKLLAYQDVLARGMHRTHLGISTLFILTVTQNETHKKNIMALLNKASGAQFFLFKTMGSLGDGMKAPLPTAHMLLEPWQRQGHPPLNIANAKG